MMNNLSEYILEKLKISKDSNIDNFLNNLEEEIINYLTGELHYEYKNDYTFEIKNPKYNDIINKIIISISDKYYKKEVDFVRFGNFIKEHLNGIFKDKKFSLIPDFKLREFTIYIRNNDERN